MNDLKNHSWENNSWVKKEIEISPGQSTYVYKFVEIWSDGSAAYLNMKFRNKGAAAETKRVLGHALKYDITEMVFMLSMRLLKYYPYRGRKADTVRIQKIVRESQSLLNAETNAEYLLMDIDKDIIHKLSNDKVLEKLDNYIEKINQVLYDFDSLSFLLNSYTLKIRKAQIENDSDQIISISREAMSRLKKKDFELPNVTYLLFLFPLISIHIEKQEFERAQDLINELYDKLDSRSVNWFAVHSSDILLNFRRLDFERVGELLDMVKRHDNDINRERNKMYGAFVSLFTNRQFPLGKYSGELNEHSKDRQGHRVNIIMVHLLHLLKYKKYGKYIDKVEAIEKYMQRYLKSTSPKVLRSRYFLKCLLLAAHQRVNFNRQAWLRRTEPLLKKLKATPKAETNQLLEQEPVDFEFLYFHIQGLLK